MKTDKQIEQLTEHFDLWSSKADAPTNGVGGRARMTKDLYPYTKLFSPITINRLTVKNRLVMAPMGNISMCEETGRPNTQMIQYFISRAKGGVGLITTGLIPVSHGIDNSITERGKLSYFPRIDRSRTVLSGWRNLAQGVHNYGARIFIQLSPGLGRVGNPQCLLNEYKFPVSSSLNPNFYVPQIPSLPLSDRKLKKIIKNMGQAAIDAKHCGLDGVYLHGHEGYLLEQMSNRAFNRRSFGRYVNWQRFGLDTIKEIRRRVGNTYPIMYRIDLSLAFNETYKEKMKQVSSLKKFQNGRLPNETLQYMENLIRAGVDIFDVDLGGYDNWWLPHPPASMPAGCYVGIAERTKKYFQEKNILSNAGKEVPVVAVGKLGYPDLAEKVLREEQCDMVMLGRPLLADEQWVNKAYAGKVEDIRPCIGCQEGCINEFVEGGHPQCAVNPRTGFEHIYDEQLLPAATKKNIAVVGAGPAGVLSAVVSAKRGHNVTLFEKSDRVGGKLNPGSVAKIKFDVLNYKIYLEHKIKEAQEKYNLQFHLNTPATALALQEGKYDTVIFAGGSKNVVPNWEGLKDTPHVQAVDLFMQPKLLGEAKNVVVIGGGAVGCEAAQWLAAEKNTNVKVVEMLPYLMYGTCTANRGHLLHALEKLNVELLNCAKVEKFSNGKIYVIIVDGKKPDPYNTWQPILPENIENPLAPKISKKKKQIELSADLIVLALGGSPDDELFWQLQKNNAAAELHNIADSFSPARVLEATRAAYALAREL